MKKNIKITESALAKLIENVRKERVVVKEFKVGELKKNLQQLGSDLLVYVGKPEDILPQLCIDLSINGITFLK